jgi:MFS family permease
MAKRPLFFYGWAIVVIGIVTTTLVYGTRSSFSVFFPPILSEFGWSRGSTAFMFSLNLLVYGFTGPIAGTLGDRWRPRRVMLIGIIILVLAVAGCSLAQELWHFYVLYGVMVPVGTALAGWPLLAPTLASWFASKRGLALGLGQCGSGLAYVVYGVFANFLIQALGWRNAYLIFAGILAAVMLPLISFVFYARPADKGLKAYGSENPLNLSLNHEGAAQWTMKRALGTYQLWLMALSQFLFWGIAGYLVIAHQVKFAEDAGYTSTYAASVFSLTGVFMALGLAFGFISDKLGREVTMTFAHAIAIVAIVALLAVTDTSRPWLLVIYGVCSGFGTGLYLPTFNAALADMYHGKHFGGIVGMTLAGFGLGGVFGPWLGGIIYDRTGSYTIGFILSIVSFVLSGVVFWLAAPRRAARMRARVFGELTTR